MAAATTVHPSPPPPRRTVARLVCTHLAWVAVVCLFLASLWFLFWGLATAEIGRLTCGEDSAVFTVAYEVASVATVTLLLILPFGLLALIVARTRGAAASRATATDIEAMKEPDQKTFGAAVRDALRDPVILALLASLAFALCSLVFWSVIYDVGALGKSAVDCFGLCPVVTVRIWRAWRLAWHSR